MVFRAVAHELSFSRAAEKLSLSQPSVSHQIALLETEIGVRLFDRDRGRAGLRLTHVGTVLLEHADHVGWRLQLADAQISDLAKAAPRRRCASARFRRPLPASCRPPSGASGKRTAGCASSSARSRRARSSHASSAASSTSPLGYQDATARAPRVPRRRADRPAPGHVLRRDAASIIPLPASTRPVALSAFAGDDWIVPSTDGFLDPGLSRCGLRAPRRLDHAGPARDARADRPRHRRRMGAEPPDRRLRRRRHHARLDEPMRRRDVYALLPPGERHPLARQVVDALSGIAGEFAAPVAEIRAR